MALRRVSDEFRFLPSTLHPGLLLFLRILPPEDYLDVSDIVVWDMFGYTSRANFRDTKRIMLDWWANVPEVD